MGKPLKVLTWPKDANVLRRISKPVDPETLPQLQGFIDDMIATMYHSEGYGLSAIQVGSDLRIFVMDNSEGPEVFVNPLIVVPNLGQLEQMDEGCLSFPGESIVVERNNAVAVLYLDRHGEPKSETRTGIDAQCFQHEIEHMDGKLLVDRVGTATRDRWASKISRLFPRRPL